MAPISSYFKGKGQQVMDNMQDEYGDAKGKQVFYATANKNKQKPKDDAKKGFAQRASSMRRNKPE